MRGAVYNVAQVILGRRAPDGSRRESRREEHGCCMSGGRGEGDDRWGRLVSGREGDDARRRALRVVGPLGDVRAGRGVLGRCGTGAKCGTRGKQELGRAFGPGTGLRKGGERLGRFWLLGQHAGTGPQEEDPELGWAGFLFPFFISN